MMPNCLTGVSHLPSADRGTFQLESLNSLICLSIPG
jgi:hypothetical protein